MAKLIKGYYKDGEWYEYGGKLYDTIGYNTNGSMTQKAISDTLGGVLELISGYSMAIRVHGDASVSNLDPFYFITDGESFTITITYNQSAIALNVISIIMDGTDITQEAYQDGIISIDRVTGNVVITVETASVTDTTMFTKRTTANGISILNDKALLKGIRGNTMMFYQRVYEPNFDNNSSTYWKGRTGYNITVSISDGICTVTGNSSHGPYLVQEVVLTEAHTYLLIAKARVISGTSGGTLYLRNANSSWKIVDDVVLNDWYILSTVRTFTSTPTSGNRWFGIEYNKTSAVMEVAWAQCIDLTRLRGNATNVVNSYNDFHKLFPLDVYDRGQVIINNAMTNYISKDSEATTLQNVALDVTALTGKLNGEGESVVIFPDGMKCGCVEVTGDVYDEIKQVGGVWKVIKRIGTESSTSEASGRAEYDSLEQEEVYILDDQTIPTELTVANGGTEEILPVNGATPTTTPAVMEIQYGAIPLIGLLGGLLGGAKGGGSDEQNYSYEVDEDNIEDKTDEDVKDEKESPIIDEKQQLKK